jgi:hypothetical protein
MNSREHFATRLDEAAEILKPLIISAPAGALVWNGKEYAPTDVELIADPTAAKWWGILKIMAALINAQQTPLSTEQLGVIRRELFGGMTSFQDLVFDDRKTHGLPKDTNTRLSAAVSKLFESFKALDTWT